jgi:hypothetical protein
MAGEITNEVLAERISNLHEMLEKGFIENKVGHEALRKAIELVGADHGSRIRVLEDWKLVFVAKFSVYSAIALFLGSVIAQVAMQLIGKYI